MLFYTTTLFSATANCAAMSVLKDKIKDFRYTCIQVDYEDMENAKSFRISLRWPIHIINSVDKTNLSCNAPHRRSTTVSLETYPGPFVHFLLDSLLSDSSISQSHSRL